MGALLDGIGVFRDGTGETDEAGDGGFLPYIRDLENENRAVDLGDLDLCILKNKNRSAFLC